MEYTFIEISLLIVLATGAGLILSALKQPTIIAYLAAGFMAGPAGLKLVTDPSFMSALSSFGIAFLLFLVGLELNPGRLRQLGAKAPLVALAQMTFTVAVGYALVHAFGLRDLAAWYVALALTFSSTIVVVKVLTERHELESLWGRITLTILLLQDLWAVAALVVLTTGSATAGLPSATVALSLGRGVLLAGGLVLASRYLLPTVFAAVARTPELLFLAALSWCFVVALTAGAVGVSIEIGAFAAGLTLAPLPYSVEISARIRSLRDFFVTIFFIALGTQLTFTGLGQLQPLLWTLTAFVLIGNPLIVFATMVALGYRHRTSLQVGLTMGMVSEFSFVLMGLGLKLGHVTPEEVALVTTVGVITIGITTYLLAHGEAVYRWLKPLLVRLNREPEPPVGAVPSTNHVLVFGYHRLGERIVEELARLHEPVLVVDFDPTVIHRLASRSVPALYGDMGDVDVLEHAKLDRARMVISTVPDVADNLLLLANLRHHGLTLPVYATATNWEDTEALSRAGAAYVIFPHYLSGEHFSLMLRDLARKPARLERERTSHLAALKQRYANHHA